jgi:[NiFe] hydrogenase small subunit
MEKEKEFYERLEKKGVSRRDFMKYCTALTATMGLSSSFVPKVAEVFALPAQRPPVIWLHFGECTGCSESLLRSQYPYIDELVLEVLSVEYHETIMAAAGHQAEEHLHACREKVRRQVHLRGRGCDRHQFRRRLWQGGRPTFLEIAKEVVPKAAATICHIGSCANFGGVPAAAPNPGGYKGCRRSHWHQDPQHRRLSAQPHQPGGHRGQLSPAGQAARAGRPGRPLFAYGKTIHDSVPPPVPFRKRGVRGRVRPKRPPWATACTKWAAAVRKPTTTAPSPSSTTAPAGRWRRVIPALAAVSPTSGTP